jgi:hypothetical protein
MILRDAYMRRRRAKWPQVTLCPFRGLVRAGAATSPDMLQEMIRGFCLAVDGCWDRSGHAAGTGGQPSAGEFSQRVLDAGMGRPVRMIELAILKLQHGSYFLSFLEHCRPVERALASAAAMSYLLSVSIRR